MNIKPALPPNDKYFIWELTDINIEEELNINLQLGEWKGYNEVQQEYKKQPNTRYILDPFDSSHLQNTYKEISKYIFNSNDYPIHKYPFTFLDKKGILQNSNWRIEIIKDSKEHYLGIHLDSTTIACTCIINLIDNKETSTEYYYDKEGTELLYKAPGNKGTGVVHINTQFLYHGVVNTNKEDRIIALSNLKSP